MQGNPAAQQEPIAVLGMGCRLPGGVESPDDLWQLLVEGRDAIQEIPATRWDLGKHFDPDPRRPLRQYVSRAGLVDGLDQFDAAFFGISRREAQCMDPQQRLLLEVCWRAFEEGGHSIERLKGRSVGVFMGISSSDYSSLLGFGIQLPHARQRAVCSYGEYRLHCCQSHFLCLRLEGSQLHGRHRLFFVTGGCAPGVRKPAPR